MAEQYRIQFAGPVKTAYVFYIEAGSSLHIPPDVDEAFVAHWEDADVVIPWPKEMPPKEAILVWAAEQLLRRGVEVLLKEE